MEEAKRNLGAGYTLLHQHLGPAQDIIVRVQCDMTSLFPSPNDTFSKLHRNLTVKKPWKMNETDEETYDRKWLQWWENTSTVSILSKKSISHHLRHQTFFDAVCGRNVADLGGSALYLVWDDTGVSYYMADSSQQIPKRGKIEPCEWTDGGSLDLSILKESHLTAVENISKTKLNAKD